MRFYRNPIISLIAITSVGCGAWWYATSNKTADILQMSASEKAVGSTSSGLALPKSQKTGSLENIDLGASNRPKIFSTPRVARKIDWAKYPGTLESQIQQALATRNGEMAADLANKLNECLITDLSLGSNISSSLPIQSPKAQIVANEQRSEAYRIMANCQTVFGGADQWVSLRSKLLDVAIHDGVIGAAAESYQQGTRHPEVLQAISRDARAGDIKSLMLISAIGPSEFAIAADEQLAARYAIELGSRDPIAGKLIQPYLRAAISLAVAIGGDVSPRFDLSQIDSHTRELGEEIARRLIARIKAPAGG